ERGVRKAVRATAVAPAQVMQPQEDVEALRGLSGVLGTLEGHRVAGVQLPQAAPHVAAMAASETLQEALPGETVERNEGADMGGGAQGAPAMLAEEGRQAGGERALPELRHHDHAATAIEIRRERCADFALASVASDDVEVVGAGAAVAEEFETS